MLFFGNLCRRICFVRQIEEIHSSRLFISVNRRVRSFGQLIGYCAFLKNTACLFKIVVRNIFDASGASDATGATGAVSGFGYSYKVAEFFQCVLYRLSCTNRRNRLACGFLRHYSVELFFERLFFAVGGFFLLGYFFKSLYCVLDRLACIKIEYALINRHIYVFNFFIILYNRRHFCKLLNCICYRSGCHYPLFEQHLFRHSGLLVKILLNCRYCG